MKQNHAEKEKENWKKKRLKGKTKYSKKKNKSNMMTWKRKENMKLIKMNKQK